MREAQEVWLDREGVRLHCVEWVAPSPTGPRAEPGVLLLHGLSSNARYWDRVAEGIEPGRRVVALDQRGHGPTGAVANTLREQARYSMGELVEDVRFVAAALRLTHPVVVGHSWGATVALEAVGTSPGFASGLVFIDGPVQSASNLFSWEEAQRIMQPPLPRYVNFDAAVADAKSDFKAAWGADLEPFVRARVMPDGDRLVLTLTAPVRLELLKGLYESQPDLLWPRLEVPATALLARRSSARISRSTDSGVDQLRLIAPQVEIKWFDTPHDIPLYMPAEIASEIDRIAASAAGAS